MQSPSAKQLLSGLCIALSLLLYPATPARAAIDVSIGIHLGVNVPVYPRLTLIRGYPVYYAPNLHLNYFFYDGWYWVFHNDHWYASSWYNGPWHWVEPEYVPWAILRIPVRYYRRPPTYFYGWRPASPPHWNERWGRDWEKRHEGWDRRDPRSVPRPAPLPDYQRNYSGRNYPGDMQRQDRIRSDKYRYQPRDSTTRQLNRPERPEPRVEQFNPQRRSPPQAPRAPQLQSPRNERPSIEQRERMTAPQQRQREAAPRSQAAPTQPPKAVPTPKVEQQNRERRDIAPQRRPAEAMPQGQPRREVRPQEELRKERRQEDTPRRRE